MNCKRVFELSRKERQPRMAQSAGRTFKAEQVFEKTAVADTGSKADNQQAADKYRQFSVHRISFPYYIFFIILT